MTVIDALTHYNRWRRGDLETLLLSPRDIGAAIDSAIADLGRLQRENVELRDALGWYAEPSNHRREVRNVGPRVNWVKSPAAFDRGARAKFVLLTMGGGQ